MKRVKIRETLYTSYDMSELSFDIDKAREHFIGLIGDTTLSPEDYDKYIAFETSIDGIGDGMTGWSLEGIRWETDEELEVRKIITKSKEYQKYLELKNKFGHIDKIDN